MLASDMIGLYTENYKVLLKEKEEDKITGLFVG